MAKPIFCFANIHKKNVKRNQIIIYYRLLTIYYFFREYNQRRKMMFEIISLYLTNVFSTFPSSVLMMLTPFWRLLSLTPEML